MRSKQISRESRKRTHVLIFDAGDKVVSQLEEYVARENVQAARFTTIGAFESCLLAFFDWQSKDYENIPVKEQTEVLTLVGDIAWREGKPVVHAHAVLGKRDGAAVGGHLKEARVRPTLELFMEEHGALKRRHDPERGLALIDPEGMEGAG